MDQIESYIRAFFPVKDEALIKKGIEVASIREIPKGQHLIRQGERVSEVGFLISGLFRFYFVDHQGKEMTDCFAYDPGFPIVPAADISAPLPINIVAMEDSRLVVFPIEFIRDLLTHSNEIIWIYNQLLIRSVTEHWEGKMVLYQYPAHERYEWFLHKHEGLIDRVPYIHIASFLGITPVSLSRLRRKRRELDNNQ